MVKQESLLKTVLSALVVFECICQIQLCAAARHGLEPAKHSHLPQVKRNDAEVPPTLHQTHSVSNSGPVSFSEAMCRSQVALAMPGVI